MALFDYRLVAFRAACCLMAVSFVCYVVGYVYPNWSSVQLSYTDPKSGYEEQVKHYQGVWQACHSRFGIPGGCRTFGFVGVAGWLQAVRYVTLCGLAATVYGLYCIIFIFWNSKGVRRHVISATIIGGLLNFAGCMVYLGFCIEANDMGEGRMEVQGKTVDLVPLENTSADYGFYLSSASSVLTVVAGIVMALINRNVDATRVADTDLHTCRSVVADTVHVTNVKEEGPSNPPGGHL